MAFSLALNVNTESLKTQANRVDATVDDIERCLLGLQQTLDATRGYWHDEAADRHRREFATSRQEILALTKRLQDIPADILQMAGVYEGAQQDNVRIASQLGTDIPLV